MAHIAMPPELEQVTKFPWGIAIWQPPRRRHEERRIDCEVEDFASEEELIGQMAAFDSEVLGLTAITPLVARANSIMRRAKQINRVR